MSLLRKIRRFVLTLRLFDLEYTWRQYVVGRFKDNQYRHDTMTDYLRRTYHTHLHSNCGQRAQMIQPDSPIWVCWFQGEEQMPPLVRACYHSIINNSGSHPVRLITLTNYRSFVELPPVIVERFCRGMITLTHLSDILRFSLLAKYGGIWLDATLWVTSNLSGMLDGAEFFSLKQVPKDDMYVSNYRWACFCIAGGKNNILFQNVRDILYCYYSEKSSSFNYFVLDYIINLVYQEVNDAKEMINHVEYNNPQLYKLSEILNEQYSAEEYARLCSSTSIHKLSWKQPCEMMTSANELTYFNYIVSQ